MRSGRSTPPTQRECWWPPVYMQSSPADTICIADVSFKSRCPKRQETMIWPGRHMKTICSFVLQGLQIICVFCFLRASAWVSGWLSQSKSSWNLMMTSNMRKPLIASSSISSYFLWTTRFVRCGPLRFWISGSCTGLSISWSSNCLDPLCLHGLPHLRLWDQYVIQV